MRTFEEIEKDALSRNIPVMQKEGIDFLIAKLNEIKASSCLEIGSAIGYSSMMMVSHVEGLKVDTIELNDERYQEALMNIQERQLSERISIFHDDALTFDVEKLKYHPYDCLFIDAAKAQYQKFFEKYVPFVKDDGIIIVDNLDFHGMIFDIDNIKNRNTKQLVKKIKRFKDWIFNHDDYDVDYYQVGDGICVIKKKGLKMKLVLSLNNKERLYDYISMGIDTFVLGGEHSFYAPCTFTLEDILDICKRYPDKTFYVSVNALYDQYMIADIEKYLEQLSHMNVHGILFQDFGVLQIVKEKGYDFDMMYAPETLNTNVATLNVLKNQGVTSAFLAKVIPLAEQQIILENIQMPLMIHAHGVEYIAASKRALLTNYQEASKVDFKKGMNDHLSLKAKNSDYKLNIYEDEKGTHIFSDTRLYTLDLFNQMRDFDYLYIETMMMDDEEAIEVASLYSDALHSLEKGTYNKDVKEYMPLLYKLRTPLDRGFLFDQTVYKLEDMRKMDDEKR